MLLERKIRQGVIGVDIGTKSVKLAQVSQDAAGYELLEAIAIPRNIPWSYDLSNCTTANPSLGELLLANDLAHRFVGTRSACTLSMAVCDVRRIQTSSSHAQSVDQIVGEELASIDRFRGEVRQFDHWLTAASHEEHANDINVLSVPEYWANQAVEELEQTGSQCEQIDGVPFSMNRAYSFFQESDEPVAILDWGYSRATLCIIEHRQPKFVRMLRQSGFGNIIEALCKSFKVDAQQAQQMIVRFGAAGPDKAQTSLSRQSNVQIQNDIKDVLEEPVLDMVKELHRTIGYLTMQNKKLIPRDLVLMGGGATMKNGAHWLSQLTDLNVSHWSPPIHSHVITPECIPLFANAIAMSIINLGESSS